jgi:hypothetical protein
MATGDFPTNCINCGGLLGEIPVMSVETRQKMSKSQTDRYKNPIIKQQWNEMMKNVYKNNPISEETKRKIGLANSISLKDKKQTKTTVKKRMVSLKKFWKNVSKEWIQNRNKKIWETRFKNKERISNE